MKTMAVPFPAARSAFSHSISAAGMLQSSQAKSPRANSRPSERKLGSRTMKWTPPVFEGIIGSVRGDAGVRSDGEKLGFRQAVFVVIAEDVIAGPLEAGEHSLDRPEKGQGAGRNGLDILVLIIAQLDDEIGLLAIHGRRELGQLAGRLAIHPPADRIAVGVVKIGDDAEADDRPFRSGLSHGHSVGGRNGPRSQEPDGGEQQNRARASPH